MSPTIRFEELVKINVAKLKAKPLELSELNDPLNEHLDLFGRKQLAATVFKEVKHVHALRDRRAELFRAIINGKGSILSVVRTLSSLAGQEDYPPPRRK